MGIVVRYVSASGEITEHALNLKHGEDRSAKGLLEILLQTLKEGIDLGGIASECYDGANVMSGEHGGIRKLLGDYCNRIIIYIHCFRHRLNLVVKDFISFVPFVADHFTVTCAYGVVVSMFDFHRSDRGSNPGRGGKIS